MRIKLVSGGAVATAPSCQDDDDGTYRPSVFYFRQAIRAADSTEVAVELGLVVCEELESLKAWVRDRGMVPPRWQATVEEAREKNMKEAGS